MHRPALQSNILKPVMKHFCTSSKLLLSLLLVAASFKVSAQTEKPPSLNHIAVFVHDLTNTTEFYKEIIGLKMIPEPFHDGRHTWFQIGEHSQLHLIKGAKSVVAHEKDGHLCFTVSSMEAFISNLNKNNIPYESWLGVSNEMTVRPDGVKQIYFKDPEGYWVEINNDTF